MKVLTILIFVLLIPLSLPAGTKGPVNYNECVLQKVRGQVTSTISQARRQCESVFPFEKKLHNYDSKVEIKWWSTSDTLHLAIKANYGDYRITRFTAAFTTIPCDGIGETGESVYTLRKEFIFDRGQEEASVYVGEDAEQFECMNSAGIYGMKKKLQTTDR